MHFGGLEDCRKDYTSPHITSGPQLGGDRHCGLAICTFHLGFSLDENPFVLTLAFGYPIIKVHEQAYVGGHKIIGGGGKIADFLVKNRMTSNVAIIEIKKPQTKLLSRQQPVSGVYTPSAELSGAINQALDQKHRFEQGIAQIKADSRIYDIEAYAVRCCLVIGQMPCDEHEQRSFEMFRGNSKDVEIITFDELLEKLKHLRGKTPLP